MAVLKALSGVLLFSLLASLLAVPSALAQDPKDVVHGNLIQFNENGAWCWYQDERAIVDPTNGVLLLGSEGSASGLGGDPRNGNVDAVMYDLHSGASDRLTFRVSGSDDHNVPAFLKLPNGNYLAMYADHYDAYSRYRIHRPEGWSNEQQFEWNLTGQRTYSNLFYLSDEDVVYNFSRADRKNPHIMVSTDYGETWAYLGLLAEPVNYVGYVNGYFKYWSNGKDRIDFVGTEYHPRDYNTSLYHGYVQGGRSYDSFGNVIDDNIADKAAPHITDFTPVFLAGTVVNGDPMTRIWDNDVVRYPDGTIAVLIKARSSDIDPAHPSNDPDHVFFYSHFDGSTWTNTYLGRAGKKLYSSEQDYTGLGALDPNDPSTIYISTPYDPRDEAFLGVHEIFRGVTADQGKTWAWSPVTEHSTRDNLRPIIPAWDEEHTALLWFRGTYFSAQRTDAAVVGIIRDASRSPAPKTFLDATLLNTFRADDSAFAPTGPSPLQGPGDDEWHIRSGYGNGGSVFASAERYGENAPLLKTELPADLEPGTYEVWVDFWGKPTADWRIRAGVSLNHMMVFRHMAAQTVDASAYAKVLSTSVQDLRLYQAYLGRIVVAAKGQIHYVYVDDYAVETGGSALVGDRARTWYDGVSYALYESGASNDTDDPSTPNTVALRQNYPNPFRSSTRIVFDVPTSGPVDLEIFDLTGRVVRTLQSGTLPAGRYARIFNGAGLPAGEYLYRLRIGDRTEVRKMILVK